MGVRAAHSKRMSINGGECGLQKQPDRRSGPVASNGIGNGYFVPWPLDFSVVCFASEESDFGLSSPTLALAPAALLLEPSNDAPFPLALVSALVELFTLALLSPALTLVELEP